MPLLKAQSAGGKASAIIQRKKALDSYYKNPGKCQQCNEIIHVRDGQKIREVRRKKFCNSSCFATYNNLRKEKTQTDKKLRRYLKRQETKVIKPKAERFLSIKNLTKGELFSKFTYYQTARSMIQKHARYVFEISNKDKCCFECGYSRHFEVCHIIPVSDFLNDTTIIKINDIDNLLALCPTHHWEFDNGYLKIENPGD